MSNSIRLNRALSALFCFLAFGTLQAGEAAPSSGMINLGERRLHLQCVGAGSPTVMIENGGGSFSVEWSLVQKLVAKKVRICSYDRAGYALSDRGPLDESIEQVMDDLHLLVRKADIATPFVFVCQSLGCLYARSYQRRFPEQISAMVFVDGTPDDNIQMPLNGKRIPISTITAAQLPGAFAEYRKSHPPLKPGSASAPPFDRLPPELQSARHWAFDKLVRDMGWLPDSLPSAESWRQEFTALRSARLSQVHPLGDLPLIVLERTKDSDAAWHRGQTQLARLSAKGRLVEADNSGHMIHLERPDLVADAIRDVISQVNRH